MRYVLIAVFVCAIGAPAASALPAAGDLSISKSATIVQVAKKAGAKSSKSSGKKKVDYGIHPLVGSGGY